MTSPQRRPTVLRELLAAESASGVILMVAAALALVIANSPLAPAYFAALRAEFGPLSTLLWINDALMAVFFLYVGLEIKREFLDGELKSWSRRILPGMAAAGGMAAPALVFLALTRGEPGLTRGWAIPAATDIAFALGVLALLGSRAPGSLKIFLTALAILDDLGAVVIIALFYTADLNAPALAAAGGVLLALIALNRFGVRALTPYLALGVGLWIAVHESGVHATVAGVLLALTIPLDRSPAEPEHEDSPLHRLEHGLSGWSSFLIVPVFGFANAGVSLAGFGLPALAAPLPLGVAAGLVLGKTIGVFGLTTIAVKTNLADLPVGASWTQMLGLSVLCGIGFTMSLFIGMLAFPGAEAMQAQVKIGVLAGSILAALIGAAILLLSHGEPKRALEA